MAVCIHAQSTGSWLRLDCQTVIFCGPACIHGVQQDSFISGRYRLGPKQQWFPQLGHCGSFRKLRARHGISGRLVAAGNEQGQHRSVHLTMSMDLCWNLLWLLGAVPILGLPWDGARETSHSSAPATPISVNMPIETEGLTGAPRLELIRREPSSDRFCGWLWGSGTQNCAPFETCVFRTDIKIVGCCRDTTNLNTCSMYTRCIDYKDVTACRSSSCSANLLVLQW